MSATYFQVVEKKRMDTANVVKRQHVGNLVTGIWEFFELRLVTFLLSIKSFQG